MADTRRGDTHDVLRKTVHEPSQGAPPAAPSGPQLGPRLSGGKRRGPNPFVVVGLAAAAGVLLAKLVDWRGNAHSRH